MSRAELRAILVAPLAAPLGYWLWHVLLAATRTDQRRFPDAEELARSLGVILAFGMPIAWLVALTLGMTGYLAVRRASTRSLTIRRWRNALTIAWGAALGALTTLVLRPWLKGDLVSVELPSWLGALLGLASAALFVRLSKEPGARR